MTDDDGFPGGPILRFEDGEETREARSRPAARAILLAAAVALIVAAVALGVVASGTGYVYGGLPAGGTPESEDPTPGDPAARKKSLAKLRAEGKRLAAAMRSRTPQGYWVIVDQTQNRIYLKRDGETVLDARCSAGSGMILKEAEGGKGRRWVFDTPRGVFKVRNRVADPAWKKPDWAFVEEGKPIPRNDGDRIEYGTLGEYAFYLGDGYMIHGTLYERLLGRSVTHGCIRVGREDLRVLWKHVQIGTPVYIY